MRQSVPQSVSCCASRKSWEEHAVHLLQTSSEEKRRSLFVLVSSPDKVSCFSALSWCT